jgi:hypothetical protein
MCRAVNSIVLSPLPALAIGCVPQSVIQSLPTLVILGSLLLHEYLHIPCMYSEYILFPSQQVESYWPADAHPCPPAGKAGQRIAHPAQSPMYHQSSRRTAKEVSSSDSTPSQLTRLSPSGRHSSDSSSRATAAGGHPMGQCHVEVPTLSNRTGEASSLTSLHIS